VVQDQIDVIAARVDAVAHEISAAAATLAPEGRAELETARADATVHQLRAASASLHAIGAPTRQLQGLGRISAT
jgi:hypothetical protein